MQSRSLRRDGVVLEARVWKEDRDYLRAQKISAGQAIRAYVAAHRGDEDVQKVVQEAERAAQRAAALRAAAMTAQERRAAALEAEGVARTAQERRTNAIAALRVAYLQFNRADQPLAFNLKWIAGRVAASHPELKGEDLVQILREVAGAPEGVAP